MIWNKKFNYPTSTRALINGKRHYDVGTHEKLPSVTTILQATQSEEKRKQKLEEWKKRMGEQYADRIRDISAMRGTSMHTYLEGYIKGERHLDLTALGQEAGRMASMWLFDQGSGTWKRCKYRGDIILPWVVCWSYRCSRLVCW